MPKCRERLAELEYVIWDGKPETANAFLGEEAGGSWGYLSADRTSIWVATTSGRKSCNLADVVLKDDLGARFVMKPLAWTLAYETIEGK